MIMRYFGGGIGHLGNSSRHQVDSVSESPDTEPEELDKEMEISNNGGNNPSGTSDIIIDYKVENSGDDDDQGSGSDSSELDSGSLGEDSDDEGYGLF